MKTNCERCGATIAIGEPAFACGHECTFCAACAADLSYVCPNCDGHLRQVAPGR